MSEFNPYVEWLELPPDLAEPNHYQLLGLVDFEGDSGRISNAADKAMSRVRSFRPGANARAWSKLLDELLLAKGRLLDADRKAEYDSDLRQHGLNEHTTPSPIMPAALAAAARPDAPDPRFPPGMGPNNSRSASKEPSRNDLNPPTKEPAPKEKEPEPTRAPQPQPTYSYVPPNPMYTAPVVSSHAPAPTAAVPNVPATAWPSSMLHPPGHLAQPAATATQPAAPVTQTAVTQPAMAQQPMQPAMAQPMHAAMQPGMQPMGQPAMAQQPIVAQLVQPGYGAPQAMPGYAGAPQYAGQQPVYGAQPAYGQMAQAPMVQPHMGQMAQPLGQPGYGQPQYGAQPYQQSAPAAYAAPQQYGQPTYAGMAPTTAQPDPNYGFGAFQLPPGTMQPGSLQHGSMQHAPMQHGMQPQGMAHNAMAHSSYALGDAPASHMPSSLPLDPMAPVQMPTVAPKDDRAHRPERFAGNPATSPPPVGTAIPKGKAVSSAPAPSNNAPATMDPPRRASAPAAAGPMSPMAPMTSASAAAAPMAPKPMAAPLAGSSDLALADAREGKNQTEQLLFYGTIAAVFVLIGAIGFAIANANRGNDDTPENIAEVNPVSPVPATTPKVNPTTVPNTNQTHKTNVTTPPSQNPNNNTIPPANTTAKPVVPPVVVEKPVDPAENMPKPPMTQRDPFEDPVPTPMPPMPANPPVTNTVPMPMPSPTPASEVKLSAAELGMLSSAMKGAMTALRDRNFSDTDSRLSEARKLAKTKDQQMKVNRLNLLADYVKQGNRAIKTLLEDPNFDAGAELQLGKSTRVVVVERSSSSIVIRINGVNKSYSLVTIPDGLAMALIEKRLDSTNPVTKVVKGAYLAASKTPTEENQTRAAEYFEEAVNMGLAEIADLALVLSDNYDFKE